MDINIKVKLMPFRVPNYVIAEQELGSRNDGFREAPKYHLSQLDSETLDRLCDEFRSEVFKKSGKRMPPQGG